MGVRPRALPQRCGLVQKSHQIASYPICFHGSGNFSEVKFASPSMARSRHEPAPLAGGFLGGGHGESCVLQKLSYVRVSLLVGFRFVCARLEYFAHWLSALTQ